MAKRTKESRIIVVLTTVSKRSEAKKLSALLLKRRLAACVQTIGPIESACWWKGKIINAKEFLLLIKAPEGNWTAIEKLMRNSHSYETPELLALPAIYASKSYFDWVFDETAARRKV